MDKHYLPRYLDEPTKIMLWTWDEFFLLMGPAFLCIFILDTPVTGIVIGGLFLMGLKKIKGEHGHFFMHHLMYWYLPTLWSFKKTPPSFIREWIG